jgi:hypothetical protein
LGRYFNLTYQGNELGKLAHHMISSVIAQTTRSGSHIKETDNNG